MPEPGVGAGQHDDQAPARGEAQERAHTFQARWVAVAESVVEDQGDALVLADEEGAGEAGDEGELLLGADAEAVEGEGDACQGTGGDGEVLVEFDGEGLIKDEAAKGDDLIALRGQVGAAKA